MRAQGDQPTNRNQRAPTEVALRGDPVEAGAADPEAASAGYYSHRMPSPSRTPSGGRSGRSIRWGAVALGAMAFVVAIRSGWSDVPRERQAVERRGDVPAAALAMRRPCSAFASRPIWTWPTWRPPGPPSTAISRPCAARAPCRSNDCAGPRPRRRWCASVARACSAASALALARLLVLQQARNPRLYTERALWEEPFATPSAWRLTN